MVLFCIPVNYAAPKGTLNFCNQPRLGFFVIKNSCYLDKISLDKKSKIFIFNFWSFLFHNNFFLDLKCSTNQYLLPKRKIINF